MGLAISVGMLAECLEDGDEDYAEYLRQGIANVNVLLKEKGLPPHEEPEEIDGFSPEDLDADGGFGYMAIHFLRRAHLCFLAKKQLTPVDNDDQLMKELRELRGEAS